MNLDELSEPTAVVVSDRLRVAERLENRVRCWTSKRVSRIKPTKRIKTKQKIEIRLTIQNPLFDRSGVVTPAFAQVPEDVLGRLGLSGPGFAAHDDRLALLQDLHVPEGLVGFASKTIVLTHSEYPRGNEVQTTYSPMANTCGGSTPRDFPWYLFIDSRE